MQTEISQRLSQKIYQIEAQVSQREALLIELLERQSKQQTLLVEQVDNLQQQLSVLLEACMSD